MLHKGRSPRFPAGGLSKFEQKMPTLKEGRQVDILKTELFPFVKSYAMLYLAGFPHVPENDA
jgi:hypothetical protein